MNTLSTRLITVLAAVAVCGGLSATTTVVTAGATTTITPIMPIEPDPGDPGGGGGGGGTPTPPAPTPTTCSNQGSPVYGSSVTSYSPGCGTGYRIHAYTARISNWPGGYGDQAARVQSYIRFERLNGDGLDARNTSVSCRDSNGNHDSDGEGNATKTTVTYTTHAPPGALVTQTCQHQATYNGVTYSTTTVNSEYSAHPY